MKLARLLQFRRLWSARSGYLRPERFRAISINNLRTYELFLTDEAHVYGASVVCGYVFPRAEVEGGQHHIRPIMTVGLRAGVAGFTQALDLNLARGRADPSVAMTWLASHVDRFGGIALNARCLGFLRDDLQRAMRAPQWKYHVRRMDTRFLLLKEDHP